MEAKLTLQNQYSISLELKSNKGSVAVTTDINKIELELLPAIPIDPIDNFNLDLVLIYQLSKL